MWYCNILLTCLLVENLEISLKDSNFTGHAFPSHQWDPRAEDTARREEDSTADNSIYRSLATCTTTEGEAAEGRRDGESKTEESKRDSSCRLDWKSRGQHVLYPICLRLGNGKVYRPNNKLMPTSNHQPTICSYRGHK